MSAPTERQADPDGRAYRYSMPVGDDITDRAAGNDASAFTVLVVEDYAPLRTLCTRVLMKHGYDSIAAASAHGAMDLLSSGVTPDVVVTDLNMPGDVTGEHLVDHLRAAHPDTGIVVITGMTTADILTTRREAVLVKPFDNHDLLDTVAGVLTA